MRTPGIAASSRCVIVGLSLVVSLQFWYSCAVTQARPNDPFIGREILNGEFRILQRIGTGGMGSVYKAQQPEMNRMVAIKILHPKLTNRQYLASRFRREARAMAQLTHPNTVKVFTYGELPEDGSLYIVMEFLEGRNLNRAVKRDGPMAAEKAVPILIQVCGALQEAQGLESSGCTATDRLRRLRVQGLLCAAEARHEEALAMYGMAYDMAVSAQAERYVLILLADMAAVHLKMGQAAQAAEQYRALAEKARHRRSQGLTLAHALAGLMAALITQQRLAEATTAGAEALLPLRRCGIFIAHCDIYAWLMACHGRLQIAAQLLGAADAFHQNSETARDAVKERARQAVIDLLATNDIAGQTQLWMLEGAAATEDTLAVMVDTAYRSSDTSDSSSLSISASGPRTSLSAQ